MGSRKENLKKSLGITEYPWSSDDDIEESNNNGSSSSSSRRQPEPRSVADVPGTSGPQASTSSQDPTVRRNQAKHDSDLFWSIIKMPEKIPLPTSPAHSTSPVHRQNPRLSEELPCLTRVMHTPASEYREQSERNNFAAADLQRIITFKRLTRNMTSSRHSPSASALYSRGNQQTNSPSEGTSTSRLNRLNQASFRRLPTTRNLLAARYRAPRNLTAVNDITPMVPSSSRPSRMRDAETDTGRASSPLVLNNSGDETDNSGQSSSNHAPPEVNLTNDEPAVTTFTYSNSTSLRGHDRTLAPALNTSTMSLEEEIVEIDADDTPAADVTIDLDEYRRQSNDYQDNITDTNLASTSTADVDPQPQQQSSQSAKRKRRSSGEISEPLTVKDFNQNLLRLLECPVCLEWMEPPMSQCRRGHLVCGRCRARLAACPVCRTTFSSVRNRAMEGVAEMLRYPCRHGCGREVRLRRRAPHEASCAARQYACPAGACRDRPPLPLDQLADHFQSRHLPMLKIGAQHKFPLKLNMEQHENWLIFAMDQYFHLHIDVDVRIIVYVSYIGPKCDTKRFTYQVSMEGQYNGRKVVYARATHSDLESSSLTVSRQDCFHLTLDQALNFVRVKNRNCDPDKFLELNLEIGKIEAPLNKDDSDS